LQDTLTLELSHVLLTWPSTGVESRANHEINYLEKIFITYD